MSACAAHTHLDWAIYGVVTSGQHWPGWCVANGVQEARRASLIEHTSHSACREGHRGVCCLALRDCCCGSHWQHMGAVATEGFDGALMVSLWQSEGHIWHAIGAQ